MRPTKAILATAILMSLTAASAYSNEPVLVGHWPLAGNVKDVSGAGLDGQATGVDFKAKGPRGETAGAAGFDGNQGVITLPKEAGVAIEGEEFTLGVRVWTDAFPVDALGDILAKHDPVARRGVILSVMSYAGAPMNPPNDRNLFFGVDDGSPLRGWEDHGHLGKAVYVCALCVHDGALYAGTFEPDADRGGRVYRFEGQDRWTDLGAPSKANAVTSLAVFNGKLHAAVSRYKAAGSALPDAANQHPGGQIFKWEDGQWASAGELPGADTATALTVYGGRLFAHPIYHRGVYRHGEGTVWQPMGDPGRRFLAMAIFNGHLYAAGNEGNKKGGVFRFEGKDKWAFAGGQQGVDQAYSFAIYQTKLHVGAWPEGNVFRLEKDDQWVDTGRLGKELEVMGMAVYNGQLFGGTLPLAEVYRYDGKTWTSTGRLDTTPEVKYRRAWSMAVFDGKLWCGTLPSGRVLSLEMGRSATHDKPLAPGWHHVAAVRRGDRLELYVDGAMVKKSRPLSAGASLATAAPLEIGRGPHDHWNGRLADLRIYRGALTPEAISNLARPPAP